MISSLQSGQLGFTGRSGLSVVFIHFVMHWPWYACWQGNVPSVSPTATPSIQMLQSVVLASPCCTSLNVVFSIAIFVNCPSSSLRYIYLAHATRIRNKITRPTKEAKKAAPSAKKFMIEINTRHRGLTYDTRHRGLNPNKVSTIVAILYLSKQRTSQVADTRWNGELDQDDAMICVPARLIWFNSLDYPIRFDQQTTILDNHQFIVDRDYTGKPCS